MAKKPYSHHNAPLIEELEPRILYSADPMAMTSPAFGAPGEISIEQPAEPPDSPAPSNFTVSEASPWREVVFVDTGIDDYETLLEDLLQTLPDGRRPEIVLLDAGRDGVAQIGETLDRVGSVDAIHILSHADDDSISLGSTRLSAKNLDDFSSALLDWGDNLAPDADILIYGCNLAATQAGMTLIGDIATLTGADVAASDDLTGDASSGGDWDLEYRIGAIDATTFDPGDGWQGTLGLTATGELLVNTTTGGAQETSGQSRGSRNAVAIDSNGNYVVVWSDSVKDGSGYGIFAQRFDATGNKVGSEFPVNETVSDNQYWALVAIADSGDFVVTWTSVNQDGSASSVYARRFDANGNAASGEFKVNDATGIQSSSSIAMAGDGRFIIVWQGNGSGDSDGIYGKLFDAEGNIVKNEFRINTTTSGAQTDPAVAMNDNGDAAVVWTSGSNAYLERIDANGNIAGIEKKVNTLSGVSKAAVALANDGMSVVAFRYWDDNIPFLGDPDDGIYYRRFDSSGNEITQTTGFGVPPSIDTGPDLDATAPAVSMDRATGDFIVTWEKTGDGSSTAIYARAFKADQTLLWDTKQINETTGGTQARASVAALDTNNFVVTWSGTGAQSGNVDADGVFIRQYSNNTLVVDTASDIDDGDTSSIAALLASKGNDGRISLREAIIAANNTANGNTPDKILFDIAGSEKITLASALPVISDAVIIDGTTDPDFSGSPVIHLDGSGLGTAADGLNISAGGSTVRGLVITGFNGDGIDLNSSGNNRIEGNHIGVDATGTTAAANGTGIHISAGSANNTIGGTTATSRNIISGNSNYGILIQGSGSTGNTIIGNYIGTAANGDTPLSGSATGIRVFGVDGTTIGGTDSASRNVISGNNFGISLYNSNNNTVQGNYIGTDATGTRDVGNSNSGIIIQGASSNNTIGGTTTGAGNVIAGNDSYGVHIFGPDATGNSIAGNLIGIDVNGTSALGNAQAGIIIYDADNNTIGGTTAGARNVISGNQTGIKIYAGSNTASGNIVQGNYIGTDISGNSAIGNSSRGIQIIAGAASNLIGGNTAAARNVISGNGDWGIEIANTGSNSNTVTGNYIGVGADGLTSLGNGTANLNGDDGIAIRDGALNNTIGGISSGAANLIVNNAGAGIMLQETTANNTIRGNTIYGNGGLAIDLNDDGISNANDAGDGDSGANGLQNTPVITAARIQANNDITLQGTLNSSPDTTFTLDFFENTRSGSHTYSETRRYIGSASNLTTDAAGNFSFNVTLTGVNVAVGKYISATATDANGNTSEVSVSHRVTLPNSTPAATIATLSDIGEGESVALDGSASSDPDGDPLSYGWDLDGDGTYGDVTGATPTIDWATLKSFGIDDDGTYTIGLQVDDGNGGTATASTTLTIENTPPILNVTGDPIAWAGTAYTLNLATSDPGNDTITSWTINWGDGQIETITGNPSTATHIYSNTGFTNNILVSVTDEDSSTGHFSNDLFAGHYVANAGVYLIQGSWGNAPAEFATDGTLDRAIQPLIGPDGKLYVTGESSKNILRFNADGTSEEIFATLSGAAGGLAFGPDGYLYVSNYTAKTIERFDPAGASPPSDFISGINGNPYGLVFGPDGNLYVNLYNSAEVLKFDGRSGASMGTFVNAGDGGFGTPEQMVFGPDGNLYIADVANDSVVKFDGATGAYIEHFISASEPNLDQPNGLAFGADANLYISDAKDGDILRYDGTTGAFIDVYASGLDKPSLLGFTPDLQVTVGEMQLVAVATDNSGNYVIVREERLSAGDGRDIVAQRYNADGSLNGAEFTINTTTGRDQFDPAVAMDADGNFVVVWSSQGQGEAASDSNIVYRLFDTTGNALTGERIANSFTSGDQQFAAVTYDGNGDFIITWSSQGQDDDTDAAGWGIYAQRFNADGSKKGEEFLVNDTTHGDQIGSDVSADDYGDFVVTWQSARRDGDGWGIYAKAFRDNGTVFHGEQRINTTTAGDQHSPAVVMGADGDYSIVWVSEGQDGDQGGIYADTIAWDDSGTSGTGEILVNTTTVGDQRAPDIAADATGNLIITWTSTGQDGDDSSETNLYRQLYRMQNSGPETEGGETVVNSYRSGDQFNPSVAADPAGNVVVAWSGEVAGGRSGTDHIRYSRLLVNENPIIQLADNAAAYSKGAPAIPIDPNLTLSDGDSSQLTSAVIYFRDGFIPTEDVLEFTDQLSISGAYDSSTGVLRLTGEVAVADYQSALRSVTYRNTSDTPDTTTQRIIEIIVNDGTGSSSDWRRIDIITGNNPPVIAAGQTFSVSELASVGDELGRISANDSDTGAMLGAWKIVSGNSDGIFSIDASTGTLRIADNSRLDFETANSYALGITVSDGTATSTPETVTIDISNAVITIPTGQAFDIDENSGANTLIGTVATDGDEPKTFIITAGDPAGIFAIDNSGRLTVASATALDFEHRPTYTLTVEVSDGTHPVSEQVVVRLNDIDEFDIGRIGDTDPYPDEVVENAPPGTVVGITAYALDNDGSDHVSYALSDSAGGRFRIESTNGEIKTAIPLDAEIADSHTIRVVATSTDGSENTRDFTIAVLDIDDIPPQIDTPTTITTKEDRSKAIPIATAADRSDDIITFTMQVTEGALTFSLSPDTTLIDGGNGRANATLSGTADAINRTLATLRYQGKEDFYGNDTLALSVTDESGQTVSKTVPITVAPVNDAPSITANGSAVSADTTAVALLQMADLAVSDIDAADGRLHLTLTVTSGRIHVNSGSSGVFIVDNSNDSATVTVTGTLSQLNALVSGTADDAQITWIGTLEKDTRSVPVEVTIDDRGNTGGNALADTVQFTIDVPARPEATTVEIDEDGPSQQLPLAALFALDNSEKAIRYTLVDNSAPGLVTADITDGHLQITPLPNQHGRAVLRLTADTAEGTTLETTVEVVVNSIPDSPVVRTIPIDDGKHNNALLVEITVNAADRSANGMDSDITYFHISNISGGTLYLPDGVSIVADGAFVSREEAEAGLIFVPDNGSDGTAVLRFSVLGAFNDQEPPPNAAKYEVRYTVRPLPVEQTTAPEQPLLSQTLTPDSTETVNDDASDDGTLLLKQAIKNVQQETTRRNDQILVTPLHFQIEPVHPLHYETDTMDDFSVLGDSGKRHSLERTEFARLLTRYLDEIERQRDVLVINSYEHLFDSLGKMRQQMNDLGLSDRTIVGTAVIASAGLSAGYVVWMLRSGLLVSSMMFSAPAWSIADPLSILNAKRDDDDESLEDIATRGARKKKNSNAE